MYLIINDIYSIYFPYFRLFLNCLLVDKTTGQVVKRKVILGELLPNGKVEVKDGLQAGDKVAVSKLRFLSDGMPVDIISQKEKRAVTAQK